MQFLRKYIYALILFCFSFSFSERIAIPGVSQGTLDHDTTVVLGVINQNHGQQQAQNALAHFLYNFLPFLCPTGYVHGISLGQAALSRAPSAAWERPYKSFLDPPAQPAVFLYNKTGAPAGAPEISSFPFFQNRT